MKKHILFFIIVLLGIESNAQGVVRHPLYRTNDNINGLNRLISDFGPRYFDESLFHRGVDYSPCTQAYAIACCPILTFSYVSSRPNNSYINTGDGWAYVHVLTGPHSNLHWKLNLPADQPLNKNIVLETDDHADIAKIFVANNDQDVLGVTRTTCWEETAITTRTVEIGDIVFRPNGLNHLHFQNGDGETAWMNTPLSFIDYNGDDSNNMTLSLRMKYNNGGVATTFPNNIIYGDNIILESDVNYQTELDLNRTLVEITPYGSTILTILAQWIFSGDGHVTYRDRLAGTSLVDEYNIRYISDLDEDETDAIERDYQQGIYPVNTSQADHLGHDVFKKNWNSQLNWTKDSPTYPDGRYNFQLRTYDIRGNVSTNPAQLNNVIIDNFKPYVKKVEVRKCDPFGNEISDQLVYFGEWTWNSTGNQLILNHDGDGCSLGDRVYVHVFTSETMSNVNITVNDHPYSLEPGTKTNEWVCLVSSDHIVEINSISVKNSSTDLAGNGLFGFENTNPVAKSSLPIRDNIGNWSNHSTQDDIVHNFGASNLILWNCYTKPTNVSYNKITDEHGFVTRVDITWKPFDDKDVVYRAYKSENKNMTPSTPLTDGWISGGSCSDTNPWDGKTYYAVSAKIKSIKSTLKSASDDCAPTEYQTFITIDDNGSDYPDINADYNLWSNNLCEFYIFFTDENNYSYDIDLDFDDGSPHEIISDYFPGIPIPHTYDNIFTGEPKDYIPKVKIIFKNGDFQVGEEITIDFFPIRIYPADYDLDVTIQNTPAMVGVPVTLTASCPNASHDLWQKIDWSWCISQTPNDLTGCNTTNGRTVFQSNESKSTSIENVFFPSPGSYLITLTVHDAFKTSETTEKVIHVADNCINATITPDFNNQTYFPDDCPYPNEFTYTVPHDFIVGHCNGGYANKDYYYLWKVKIYVDGEYFRTVDFRYNYYIAQGYLPEPIYSYDRFQDRFYIDYLDPLSVEYTFGGTAEPFHTIGYEVWGRRYNIYTGGWIGDSLSNMITKQYEIMDCNWPFICDTKTKLDWQISRYQYNPIEQQHGYFIFQGNGGKIENISEGYNVVARKGVILNSGVRISNSPFRASVVPCDYSVCEGMAMIINEPPKSELLTMQHKSELLSELLSNNSSLILHKIRIYPNPVCDLLNVDIVETSENVVSKIGIYDIAGRNVKIIQANGNNHVIDVADLRKGIYIISVNSAGKVYNSKFIKE